MCNLLVGVNTKPDNSEFTALIKAQYSDLNNMKDGLAATIITFDNKIHIFRDYFDYDEVYERVDALLPEARFISLHSRLGTSGIKGIGNVHFFKSGDYIMAHNGFVPGMGTYNKSNWNKVSAKTYCGDCKKSKTGACDKHADSDDWLEALREPISNDEACDSLNFLRQMPKPMTPRILDEYAEEKKFTGMAVVINVKTLEATLLIEKLCHALTDKKSYGVYFSYTPTKFYKSESWKYLFGVPVKDEGERISFSHLDSLPISKGVFNIAYKKPTAIES